MKILANLSYLTDCKRIKRLEKEAKKEAKKYNPELFRGTSNVYTICDIRREMYINSGYSNYEKYEKCLKYIITYSELISDIIFAMQTKIPDYRKLVYTILHDNEEYALDLDDELFIRLVTKDLDINSVKWKNNEERVIYVKALKQCI